MATASGSVALTNHEHAPFGVMAEGQVSPKAVNNTDVAHKRRSTSRRVCVRAVTYNTGTMAYAKTAVEYAIKNDKVFAVIGGYPTVRACMRKRGWVEKCYKWSHSKLSSTQLSNEEFLHTNLVDGIISEPELPEAKTGSPSLSPCKTRETTSEAEVAQHQQIMSRLVRGITPSFIWTCRRDLLSYNQLQRHQVVNHFRMADFTTKVGLCNSLRNLCWFESVDPDTFFPRCYLLNAEDEKTGFIEDFHITACISILKIIAGDEYNGKLSNTSWTRKCDVHLQTIVESIENDGADKIISCTHWPVDPPKTGDGDATNVPLRAVQMALNHCQHWIHAKNHMFIDVMPTQENELADMAERAEIIRYYYKLVREGANIVDGETLRASCIVMLFRLDAYMPMIRVDGVRNIWIVKPCAKSRGRGITCLDKMDDILAVINTAVALREGKYVVQKYIEQPYLVYNTKFDIRQWFLVTDWNPVTVWLYTDCYLRFCSEQYTLEKFDESIHLCNNAIQSKYENGIRNKHLPEDNMWTKDQFLDYLGSREQRHVWSEVIYPGMKKAIICALISAQDHMNCRKNSFELYGADFLLSQDMNPWLIEINASPALGSTTSVTEVLCKEVIEDTLKVVIDRKVDRFCDTGAFELAYRQPMVAVPPVLGVNLVVEGHAIPSERSPRTPRSFLQIPRLLIDDPHEAEIQPRDGARSAPERIKMPVSPTLTMSPRNGEQMLHRVSTVNIGGVSRRKIVTTTTRLPAPAIKRLTPGTTLRSPPRKARKRLTAVTPLCKRRRKSQGLSLSLCTFADVQVANDVALVTGKGDETPDKNADCDSQRGVSRQSCQKMEEISESNKVGDVNETPCTRLRSTNNNNHPKKPTNHSGQGKVPAKDGKGTTAPEVLKNLSSNAKIQNAAPNQSNSSVLAPLLKLKKSHISNSQELLPVTTDKSKVDSKQSAATEVCDEATASARKSCQNNLTTAVDRASVNDGESKMRKEQLKMSHTKNTSDSVTKGKNFIICQEKSKNNIHCKATEKPSTKPVLDNRTKSLNFTPMYKNKNENKTCDIPLEKPESKHACAGKDNQTNLGEVGVYFPMSKNKDKLQIEPADSELACDGNTVSPKKIDAKNKSGFGAYAPDPASVNERECTPRKCRTICQVSGTKNENKYTREPLTTSNIKYALDDSDKNQNKCERKGEKMKVSSIIQDSKHIVSNDTKGLKETVSRKSEITNHGEELQKPDANTYVRRGKDKQLNVSQTDSHSVINKREEHGEVKTICKPSDSKHASDNVIAFQKIAVAQNRKEIVTPAEPSYTLHANLARERKERQTNLHSAVAHTVTNKAESKNNSPGTSDVKCTSDDGVSGQNLAVPKAENKIDDRTPDIKHTLHSSTKQIVTVNQNANKNKTYDHQPPDTSHVKNVLGKSTVQEKLVADSNKMKCLDHGEAPEIPATRPAAKSWEFVASQSTRQNKICDKLSVIEEASGKIPKNEKSVVCQKVNSKSSLPINKKVANSPNGNGKQSQKQKKNPSASLTALVSDDEHSQRTEHSENNSTRKGLSSAPTVSKSHKKRVKRKHLTKHRQFLLVRPGMVFTSDDNITYKKCKTIKFRWSDMVAAGDIIRKRPQKFQKKRPGEEQQKQQNQSVESLEVQPKPRISSASYQSKISEKMPKSTKRPLKPKLQVSSVPHGEERPNYDKSSCPRTLESKPSAVAVPDSKKVNMQWHKHNSSKKCWMLNYHQTMNVNVVALPSPKDSITPYSTSRTMPEWLPHYTKQVKQKRLDNIDAPREESDLVSGDVEPDLLLGTVTPHKLLLRTREASPPFEHLIRKERQESGVVTSLPKVHEDLPYNSHYPGYGTIWDRNIKH